MKERSNIIFSWWKMLLWGGIGVGIGLIYLGLLFLIDSAYPFPGADLLTMILIGTIGLPTILFSVITMPFTKCYHFGCIGENALYSLVFYFVLGNILYLVYYLIKRTK